MTIIWSQYIIACDKSPILKSPLLKTAFIHKTGIDRYILMLFVLLGIKSHALHTYTTDNKPPVHTSRTMMMTIIIINCLCSILSLVECTAHIHTTVIVLQTIIIGNGHDIITYCSIMYSCPSDVPCNGYHIGGPTTNVDIYTNYTMTWARSTPDRPYSNFMNSPEPFSNEIPYGHIIWYTEAGNRRW